MGDWLYTSLIGAIWLAWTAYWIIARRGTKANVRRESALSRASHIVPLVLGIWLIASPIAPWPWLSLRLLPDGLTRYWVGVACLIAGLTFTVWARLHLGRNWSGTVTLKEGHELIRTGPYGLVRHPIYTGLLFAILGCAVARGQLQGLIGFAISAAALIRKLGIEERWMREHFGLEYQRYSAQVPALMPSLRGTRRTP